MFGLFESKEAKFWRAETIQTLKIADQRFDDRKKKTIATNVLKRTLDLLKELDGLTAKEKKEAKKIADDIKLTVENNIDNFNQTAFLDEDKKQIIFGAVSQYLEDLLNKDKE